MNIDFDWNSINLAPDQRAEIERNISNEIEQFEHFNDFPAPPNKLRVALFGDRLLHSLNGIATNTAGDVLVKITYQIDFPHSATYDYVKPQPTAT